MKVGRREFLKLAGSAAAGAVVPFRAVEVNDDEGEWHCLAVVQGKDGFKRRYIDGQSVTALSLSEYADQLGIKLAPWMSFGGIECDCPLCRELSGKLWVEPEPPPEPEYDCDYYYAISQGAQNHRWIDPLTGAIHHAVMEWYDHGLHTYLHVDGFRVGRVLSKDVPDPGNYLRSIWSCGLLAAAYMVAGPEEQS